MSTFAPSGGCGSGIGSGAYSMSDVTLSKDHRVLPGCIDSIGWRPMDSAPRDGSRILTFNITPVEDEDTGRVENVEAISIAYWCLGGWMEYPARPRWIRGQRHLCWMPMP